MGSPRTEQQLADELRPIWQLNQRLCLKRDLNLRDAITRWASQKEEDLKARGVSTDFVTLCDAGCCPELLTILVGATELAPHFSDVWHNVLANARLRHKVTQRLEKAADALESLQLGSEAAGIGESNIWSSSSGLPSIGELDRGLRFYASCFRSVGDLNLGKSSILNLTKFALSAYVESKTGKPHDEEVSSLIGAALRDSVFTEAHKMWRSRNFERLKKSHSELLRWLSAVEILLTSEK
jgi:hypothetical protein